MLSSPDVEHAAAEAAGGGSNIFSTIMYLLSGTVLIRVVNYHYIKLAPSVMTALSAVIWGAVLLGLQKISPDALISLAGLRDLLRRFPEIVMDYMLGFLLFAAAIEVDLGRLGRVRTEARSQKRVELQLILFAGSRTTSHTFLFVGVCSLLVFPAKNQGPLNSNCACAWWDGHEYHICRDSDMAPAATAHTAAV